jgi:hypothetical protein
MFRWFDVSPLRDREPQGGGGDTIRTIDPGAEHQLDDDDEPGSAAKPAVKTPAEKEADDLKAENIRLKKIADDNAADAKFWSDRAKRNGGPGRAVEEEPETRTRRAVPEPIVEKPEELIDDLNKKGLQALKERGVISKAELEEALETVREQTAIDINDARSEAVFSARLEAEFPEMMEDSARAAKGLPPKSELFIKAGEIYRELVDLDPSLKNSRGLLVIAARQAKAAIEKGNKGKGRAAADDDAPPSRRASSDDDDQRQRRAKIERQTPDRRRDDEDTGGGAGHSQEALTVMKHLKVKPEDFDRHKDGAPTRRRR